ncbi:unnamed protein product, partial [Closterium sp. NIES-53]
MRHDADALRCDVCFQPGETPYNPFLCCSLCATAVHQLCYGAVGLPPLWAARSLLPPSLHAPLPPLLPLASEGKVEGEGLGRESDQSRHGGGGGGGGAAAAAGQGVYAGEGGGMQLSKQAAARRFKWRCVPCHLHARACSSGGTASSTCSQPPPLTCALCRVTGGGAFKPCLDGPLPADAERHGECGGRGEGVGLAEEQLTVAEGRVGRAEGAGIRAETGGELGGEKKGDRALLRKRAESRQQRKGREGQERLGHVSRKDAGREGKESERGGIESVRDGGKVEGKLRSERESGNLRGREARGEEAKGRGRQGRGRREKRAGGGEEQRVIGAFGAKGKKQRRRDNRVDTSSGSSSTSSSGSSSGSESESGSSSESDSSSGSGSSSRSGTSSGSSSNGSSKSNGHQGRTHKIRRWEGGMQGQGETNRVGQGNGRHRQEWQGRVGKKREGSSWQEVGRGMKGEGEMKAVGAAGPVALKEDGGEVKEGAQHRTLQREHGSGGRDVAGEVNRICSASGSGRDRGKCDPSRGQDDKAMYRQEGNTRLQGDIDVPLSSRDAPLVSKRTLAASKDMPPALRHVRWVHVTCALFDCHVFFGSAESLQPIMGVATSAKKRAESRQHLAAAAAAGGVTAAAVERCAFCHQPDGPLDLIPCAYPLCSTRFHVRCGLMHGCSTIVRETDLYQRQVTAFCASHAAGVEGGEEEAAAPTQGPATHGTAGCVAVPSLDKGRGGTEVERKPRHAEGEKENVGPVKAAVDEMAQEWESGFQGEHMGAVSEHLGAVREHMGAVREHWRKRREANGGMPSLLHLVHARMHQLEAAQLTPTTPLHEKIVSPSSNLPSHCVAAASAAATAAVAPAAATVDGDGGRGGYDDGGDGGVSADGPRDPWEMQQVQETEEHDEKKKENGKGRAGVVREVRDDIKRGSGEKMREGAGMREQRIAVKEECEAKPLASPPPPPPASAATSIAAAAATATAAAAAAAAAATAATAAASGTDGNKSACVWCAGHGAAVQCFLCALRFCYQCFKRRKGYGVKGWTTALRQPSYTCRGCLGEEARADMSVHGGAGMGMPRDADVHGGVGMGMPRDADVHGDVGVVARVTGQTGAGGHA